MLTMLQLSTAHFAIAGSLIPFIVATIVYGYQSHNDQTIAKTNHNLKWGKLCARF